MRRSYDTPTGEMTTVGPPTVWVRGCARCGQLDLDSLWPRAEHVSAWPRWRCAACLSACWEPTPTAIPDLAPFPRPIP